MGDKETITMKDIARDLGVSVATVSRALKDSSRISTAQKERIQKGGTLLLHVGAFGYRGRG